MKYQDDDDATLTNYQSHFSLALFAEELQLEVDIRHYDLEVCYGRTNSTRSGVPSRESYCLSPFQGVTMKAEGKRNLVLEVPGLAENRPSVLRGDAILVMIPNDKGTVYKGYVHDIRNCEVVLGFGDALLKK